VVIVTKKFPDLTGDGKVTRADVLKGRGVDMKAKGGKMVKKPSGMKPPAKTFKGMKKG
jgi:hypothetical protein